MEGLLLLLVLVLVLVVVLLTFLGEGRMRKWGTRGNWVFSCPWGRALGPPECVYAQLHTTIQNQYVRNWHRGVVYKHSPCRQLATQGALQRPARRCSVATSDQNATIWRRVLLNRSTGQGNLPQFTCPMHTERMPVKRLTRHSTISWENQVTMPKS